MKRISVSEQDSLPGFALKVVTGRSIPQHMFEWLVQGLRVTLDSLPAPLSHRLRGEIRNLYGVTSERRAALEKSAASVARATARIIESRGSGWTHTRRRAFRWIGWSR